MDERAAAGGLSAAAIYGRTKKYYYYMIRFLRKKINLIMGPKTPYDFVKKVISDSRKKYCQLELYYKGRIILQLESLKHVPIWLKWANVDKETFSNGFIVHFFIEKNNLDNNSVYKKYLLNKNKLNMVEFEDINLGIINFSHFFKEGTPHSEISTYMKKLIDSIYSFKENNPQLLFNIRYMKS